jgi:hypothetical protein
MTGGQTLHAEREANPKAKRPKLTDADMDFLVEAAWKAGAHCVRAGNKHVKVFPVNGSRMISIPATPSDHRTFQNKRSALRRGGIPVE